MTGRSEPTNALIETALAWQRALEHDDADWEAFTVWLEEAPSHAKAFADISLVTRTYDDHAEALQQSIATEQQHLAPTPRRHLWIGGSIAAAIAVMVAIPLFWQSPADVVYTTSTGEHRLVRLAGGTAIDLGPSTQLIAQGGNPDDLRLERGQAYFNVTHNPQRTLSISAGKYAVSDIGTQFEINRVADTLTIAVAEGQISVTSPDTASTRLSTGQQFVAAPARPTTIGAVSTGNVGTWRQGRLIYSNIPLSVVVADITRNSGEKITIDPTLGQRTFSGVLVVEKGPQMLANLADLMAITYVRNGDQYSLRAAGKR
ncbi:putative anti-sigma factor [Caenibius tardaugens NBRC 16725]|uniref:Putative anti-sigma factor n=1 Tax=Caenibius tardaugens NBRC 16725 TaxID=1219035 RepID=U2ZV84_9SPHN|nr:FecR domain-containing protein [Caenibius tardaugens]AZI36631.1 hypothetical protein EGO55_12260 [Caenibius tardaugens NBRC 16725]GAD49284.1 putative anti-sigma factor [Caenibius tardaugens NBRC 16725]